MGLSWAKPSPFDDSLLTFHHFCSFEFPCITWHCQKMLRVSDSYDIVDNAESNNMWRKQKEQINQLTSTIVNDHCPATMHWIESTCCCPNWDSASIKIHFQFLIHPRERWRKSEIAPFCWHFGNSGASTFSNKFKSIHFFMDFKRKCIDTACLSFCFCRLFLCLQWFDLFESTIGASCISSALESKSLHDYSVYSR